MVALTSRGSQYAIRALVHLVRRRASGCCPVRQITIAEAIPHHFLAKLVGRLTRVGLVDASKGPGGGIRLARDPRTIKVLEVIAAVEGPEYLNGCFLGLPQCSDEMPCPMHEQWKSLKGRLRTQLEGVTIAELAASMEGGGGAVPTAAP